MTHADRQSLKHRIGYLFSCTAGINDFELQAEIAKYLCILPCAFLEASCKDIVSNYVSSRSNQTIAAYIDGQLEFFRNPKLEKILQLIGAFDKSKRNLIETDLGDDLKDAVDSIVNNRNNLAHGRNVVISLAQIKDYYQRACKLLSVVEREFQ